METMLHNNSKAMIVLHEIYGVNKFIKSWNQRFFEEGYDVYCPNLLHRSAFSNEESEDAYRFFVSQVGFEVYTDIIELARQLQEKYEEVYITGFSVGATIAWRACEHNIFSGVIACYGSRIRDYIDVNPACPTLVLFAKEDSFDVKTTVSQLQGKENLEIQVYEASHGFLNRDAKAYNEQQAKLAESEIFHFIKQ